MLILAAAIACVALVAGCGEQERTVRVVSDRTDDVKRVDLPPRGKSPGEVVAFSSVLLDDRERRPIGRVHGTQTSIRIEGARETVQGLLTFQLGRGDEIVVGGLSEASGNGTVVGRRYVRPVLGGTGEYAGARTPPS